MLLLADITIDNGIDGSFHHGGCLLAFNATWKRVNYRRWGVGSALLRSIIDRATVRGFTSITGEIFLRDYQDNPHLPDWYRHHGFSVTMIDSKQASVVAMISLSLSSDLRNPLTP
ncbi:MAG: GNAT family N-acetyltransferase [Armatimonadota bacterium]